MINRKSLIELIKYGFWGIITTAINLLLFVLFEKMGMYYICSNTLSYYIACVINFYFNQKVVFKMSSDIRTVVQLFRFLLLRTVSILVDNILFYILVDYCMFNLYISRICLSIAIILLTFIINKKYIFEK